MQYIESSLSFVLVSSSDTDLYEDFVLTFRSPGKLLRNCLSRCILTAEGNGSGSTAIHGGAESEKHKYCTSIYARSRIQIRDLVMRRNYTDVYTTADWLSFYNTKIDNGSSSVHTYSLTKYPIL